MSRTVFILTLFILLAVCASSYSFAENLHAEIPWKARVEISYVNTSGNTDTQTFAGKFEIKREGYVNRYFLDGSALRAESDGEETSNKFLLEGRWERVFTERFFGLLTGGFSRDTFSGYDYRVFGGPGIGYDLIKTEEHTMQGLVSFLYYYDEFSVSNRSSDDYIAGKATFKYKRKIQENLTFKETVDYFVSFEDTDRFFVDSDTSMEVKINSALSLGVSFLINYQNELPSPDLQHTDTTFLTKLIVDF
jgi:putative salt-induced outer membrane protein